MHKKKSSNLASLLIADRFAAKTTPKRPVQRNSVTQFTPLSMLAEKLATDTNDEHDHLLGLSIPPRLPYTAVERGQYRAAEARLFSRWKQLQGDRVFERNIEVWRQFWLACERATTIAQIVDARDPWAYYNEDINKMYPDKKHIVLANKADLARDVPQLPGVVHSYSATGGAVDFGLTGTVCFVGYPNVGKSSTINMVLNQKRVRVSSTPGKTRCLQTIETPDFTVLDSPGLVFPKHSKVELILMGVLNVDHITDLGKYEREILLKIGAVETRKSLKETVKDWVVHKH